MKTNLLNLITLYAGFLIPFSFLITSCAPERGGISAGPIYLNTAYSFEERAADLVSRMTLEEKQSQLGNVMPAIPRLGIHAYNVWGEALHGVVGTFINHQGPVTSFPNSVAMGASWDPDLMEREARTISDEARALNHDVISNLTFWSPVVEPVRDPRWGRTGECYGEDPFLISRIGGAFIRGMMGDDERYIKAVPCGKHYFANNSEFNRHTGSSDMDRRDAREYYLAPYKYLIENDNLPAIMSCYNAVNGIPVSANKFWIDTVARRTFGLNGYVTGDCGAIDDITNGHSYAESRPEATSMGLKAGVDTDCGNVYQANAIQALRQGLIREADMDQALVHIFTVRMRFGEFDPKEMVPYSTIPKEVVNSPEHHALAVEVATKTPVLLKNEVVEGTEQKALPLQAADLKSIAVFGPLAQRVELGPYSGNADEANSISPVDGIRNWIAGNGLDVEVKYRAGAHTVSRSDLFYVSDFEIVSADGTVKKYDATAFDDAARGVLVSSWRLHTLRGLKDGDWTSYNKVDLSHAIGINLNLTVTGTGGTIEVREGSPDGRLIASFPVEAHQETGEMEIGRFGSARSLTSRVNRKGLQGDQTLVLVFHAAENDPIDQETVQLAESADVAIVYVGTDNRTASEEADRYTLLLPGNQYELIEAVSGVNPNTVVVIQSLGMVEVDPFRDHPSVAGIVWAGYNGQGQGAAMARILFGDVNPGGKLNTTWYRTLDDLPELTDYELRGGGDKNGRTYWYFDKEVSYEFGYGLSYTSFEYSNFQISNTEISPNDVVTVEVDVQNTGNREGDEVVQVYVSTPESPATAQRPIKRLKGFRRVTIPADASRHVVIDVDCADLWFWDPVLKKMTYDPGQYVFGIGASSKDIRGEVTAVMGGDLKPELKTVTAGCGQVILKPGKKVQTTVTAAMSDDSFYDMERAKISYKSNDPSVATVDRSGAVTAREAGVAAISATVTIDGKRVSDSYPVKVVPDLTLVNLTLDEEEIPGFDPGVYAYSVMLTGDTQELPQVAAEASGDAMVEVAQAGAVPGTAVVTVTDNRTGESDNYKVNFGIGSTSDEFEGNTLGGQWRLIREDAEHWELSDNMLEIDLQGGTLRGERNDAKNLLLQEANGDWTIESGVILPEVPPTGIMQCGLVAYQDDDDYVKLIYRSTANMDFGPGGFSMNYMESVQLVSEVEGAEYVLAQAGIGELLTGNRAVVLKLEKKGAGYTGSYSIGGKEFTLESPVHAVLSDVKAGLLTCQGDATRSYLPIPVEMFMGPEPQGIRIKYDYFRITNE